MGLVDSGVRSCPACDSISARILGYKNSFELLSCQGCDTIYTRHLPPPTGVQEYYDNYYGDYNLNLPEFVHQQLDKVVTTFSPYRQHNRLLDVGFGAGALMQAASRAGWEVQGTEVSASAVRQAEKLGFTAFQGELAAAQYPDHYFDVVTAVEVFEHVPDPRSLLQDMTRILRPRGLLWLTTPHGQGISWQLLKTTWSIVDPPEHLQLFSMKGMSKLLESNGLKPRTVLTQGTNPIELVRALRTHGKDGAENTGGGCERVEANYQLNESLTSSPSRLLIKNAANGILSASHLGDSLKVWAVL